MPLSLLAIGDVVGKPGRRIVQQRLPALVRERNVRFVVCNAENSAGGAGLNLETAEELLKAGCHVLTCGDHVFDQREIIPYLDRKPELLRPANLSPEAAGRGWGVYELPEGTRVGVVHLMGRAFMAKPTDCPFHAAAALVAKIRTETPIVVVDFHAEVTSEKIAMGWHLDGKASLVFGTHTHVQTADERVLPMGCAHITDVGMTGPHDGVLGRRADRVLAAFLTQMPQKFDVADGDVRLHAVLVTVDPASGRAQSIERISLREEAPR